MMRKYRSISTLLFILVAFLNFSCELSDSPSEEDVDLIPNNWVVEKVLIDGIEDIATNYGNYRLTFSAEGSYILRDIYGMEEQGEWSITNGSQLLLTNNQQESKQYIIVSLVSDRLVLLFKDAFFKETEANFEYTLVPE
jgi:hypothetical protein